MDVSFTSLDSKDSKKFSFITNDSDFGLLYCHAFVISDGKADAIPHTIAEAFSKATEKLKTASAEERRQMQRARGTSGALGVFDVRGLCPPTHVLF